jgi:hypothetical protein
VPDETTVCRFRHLLEEHDLGNTSPSPSGSIAARIGAGVSSAEVPG